MITTLTEAQESLNKLTKKYYSEEEYTLELSQVDANTLNLTCKTDYQDFGTEPIYLPLPDFQFEEEVARLADNANWALAPVIDPNDIEIEGL
jgi:hypothetical protein